MTELLTPRKSPRLKNYDYSTNRIYFITVCTQDRMPLFGKPIPGAESNNTPVWTDSLAAKMVNDVFLSTICEYKNVDCLKYVIMPDHIHALIIINSDNPKVTLYEIVQKFKRLSTNRYIEMVKEEILPPFNRRIWQKSFYDHIIRDDEDYEIHWNYIDRNPQKWILNEHFEE